MKKFQQWLAGPLRRSVSLKSIPRGSALDSWSARNIITPRARIDVQFRFYVHNLFLRHSHVDLDVYTLVMGAPAIQLHGERIVRPAQKEIQAKAMKGLLDFAILNFLRVQPMHGYQIISRLRKDFGVYFGPSTIYPLLSVLEKQGYVKGQWDLENARARPRKVYNLTSQGADMLTSMAVSLTHIYKKLTKDWTSAQR